MRAAEPENGALHEGGCLCGEIRYRIAGPIDSVAHCHCSMCRRSAGALVVTWFSVPRARFAVTRGKLARWKSSRNAERTFCPSCGAQIGFRSLRYPDDIDVTLGTLDRPEQHPADRHVWISDKLPWLRLDEHLPASAGFTPDTGGES